MFVEEAHWIGDALGAARLAEGGEVLDVGSSTGAYRLESQPHIVAKVLDPLRERGMRIVHLDIKDDPGIDIVQDITAPGFDPEVSVGRRFDLVMCTSVLLHVRDIPRAVASVYDLTAPGGYLLVTVPHVYRKTRDPLDNGFRPSPDELVRAFRRFGAGDLRTLRLDEVRIDDPRYYRGLVSRPTRLRIGRRWVPLPGAAEQFLYRWRKLRWRVSCAVLQRSEATAT